MLVMVGACDGLEHWDQRSGAFRLIEEPRLSRLLRLRLQADNRLATTGDPQLRTPRWMFATLAGHRQRLGRLSFRAGLCATRYRAILQIGATASALSAT